MSDGIVITWGLEEDEKTYARPAEPVASDSPVSTAPPPHKAGAAPVAQRAAAAPAQGGSTNGAEKDRVNALEAELHHMKTEISLRDNRIHVLTQKMNDLQEENKKLQRLLEQAETVIEDAKKKPWWKKV